jgi:DNA-binding NtrC family response regulator
LEQKGYRTLTARNAQEALNFARSNPFEVLLTDMILPDQDGRELAKRVLADHPEMLVAYMTGYPGSLPDFSCDRRSTLIEKPFSPETLLLSLRRLIDNVKDIRP